jgi:hypothetical protein
MVVCLVANKKNSSVFVRLIWLASKLQFASQLHILAVWLSTGRSSSYYFSQVVTLSRMSKEQRGTITANKLTNKTIITSFSL